MPAIHAVLNVVLFGAVALFFLMIGNALFIGLPALVLVGIGKAVVWLFRPVAFGDPE